MRRAVRQLIPAIVFVFTVLAVWPGQALSAEFSADLVRTSGGDKDTSKVFIKGKLRREEIMDDGKVGAINISRPDKGVNWNLMPEDRMYMEIPIGGMDAGAMENMEELDSRAKAKILGKETVNGYTCEKRLYDDKTQAKVTVWYSDKLDYPVKIHMDAFGGEEELTMEFTNIKPGKVDDSKFEIPAGYEKFAIPGMPAGMPAGMPQGMPGGMPKMPGMGN
jgi:hypothetical protein